ncbi:hypothetical protein [Bacillus sp. JJ722]|uniref:hypothetical protein n=1 Tax=Bacillus sp. JJ722 TaxID=3122973 RepID=UPI002FFE3C44
MVIFVAGCSFSNEKNVEDKPELVETEKQEQIVKDPHTEKAGLPSAIMVDSTVIAEGGQSNIGFKYPGDVPLKIQVKNVGVNTFHYKIQHLKKDLILKQGTLKPDENYSNIYESVDDLPKGDYIIYFDQENGAKISANTKTELIN